jgi:hypothetical protein
MEHQYNNQASIPRSLLKLGLIIAGALVFDKLTNESDDTVNYTLYYKGKKVYHGISYEDCFQERINQHERAGIIRFDYCEYDYPKTRTTALALERKRINRDQTRYNNHHR